MTKIGLMLAFIGSVLSQDDMIQKVGNPLTARITGVETPAVTFLLRDTTPSPGVVFAFSAYFRAQSKVRLQVWRPSGTTPSGGQKQEFTLLGDFRVTPTAAERVEDVYIMSLLSEQCVRVNSDDRFGIFFEEAPGAIAFDFDSSNPDALASTLDNATIPNEVGDTAIFDTLSFPYDFSIVAYVYTNLTGVPNIDRPDCPRGLKIPQDLPVTLPPTTTTVPPTGAPGARGPRGPIGQSGPKGAAGTDGANGLSGVDGVNGTNGIPGAVGQPGAAGPRGLPGQGEKGEKGDIGPAGPPGERGLIGPPGPAGGKDPNAVGPDPVPSSNESNSSGQWLGLAALIWLAVLTLIVLAVIIIIFYVHRKRERERKKQDQYKDTLNGNALYVNPTPLGSTNDLSTRDATNRDVSNRERVMSTKSDVSEPGWIKGMKEGSESQFSHDTIERADSRPNNGEGNIRTSELRNY